MLDLITEILQITCRFFLSVFFLVTSHGLKSSISCSMSWQIIQQKDR